MGPSGARRRPTATRAAHRGARRATCGHATPVFLLRAAVGAPRPDQSGARRPRARREAGSADEPPRPWLGDALRAAGGRARAPAAAPSAAPPKPPPPAPRPPPGSTWWRRGVAGGNGH